MRRLFVFVVAMALVIGACSGDDAASTTTIDTPDLTGVWKTPNGLYLVLANDGTYQAMTNPPGADSDTNDQFEWGTYTITDTTLVFVVAEDAVLFTECKVRDDDGEWVGIDGTYQVEAIADDGQTWTAVLVDDACAIRARDFTGQFTKHTS